MPKAVYSCYSELSHGLATYKTICREQYCLIFAITLDMRNETICTSTVELECTSSGEKMKEKLLLLVDGKLNSEYYHFQK